MMGPNYCSMDRKMKVPGYENGNFIGPTILGNVNPESEIYNTEIFGPVL